MTARHEFFKKRLEELGLFAGDSDYEGIIGKNIEELSEVFSKQGHSGISGEITLAVFNKLMDEWEQQGKEVKA